MQILHYKFQKNFKDDSSDESDDDNQSMTSLRRPHIPGRSHLHLNTLTFA
jgi:hypothetical protein